MRVAVTGGSGKAGRAVVRDLLEHGHEVLNVDLRGSAESGSPHAPAPLLIADLTDFGETLEALSGGERLPGIEAVVHLAAIPSPVHATPDVVFRTNITSTHTVFAAAARLGLQRVVWASSETTLGLPFETPPDYAPVDAQTNSGRSRRMRCRRSWAKRRHASSTAGAASRSSGSAFQHHGTRRLRAFPSYWDYPQLRRWNLWSYVDESHVGLSVRRALEADLRGAEAFIIAAPDTVMRRPSSELMAESFPSVPLRSGLGEHETLLSIDKARRLLGYDPAFTWRELF